jgi:hypothetical protein
LHGRQPRRSWDINAGATTRSACAEASARQAVRIVIDPFQRTQWRGSGIKNIRDAEFGSDIVLPGLLDEGVTVDFAFVDGWHTFDQVPVEFYDINRLLRVGGVIAFDDANRRSINRSEGCRDKRSSGWDRSA